MKKIVMFGAGAYGKYILPIIAKQFSVEAIIDTYKSKIKNIRERNIYGVPIISLEEYLEKYRECEIIITVNYGNYSEVEALLIENNIKNFCRYQERIDIGEDKRERLLSYSLDMEDVILYHVFKNTENIFYIDVGSNDPIVASVTKLLYDTKNARGINIEPQQHFIDISNQERERDINLCTGVGEEEDIINFYIQGNPYVIGGGSTAVQENVNEIDYQNKTSIPITTLFKICERHVAKDQKISFLKIDVEGYEKSVLLGADFKKYRPQVIVIEAYSPSLDTPHYDEWEYILIENEYHFAYEYGMDRYYVADECSELDARFIPILELMKQYCVYTMRFSI